MNFVAKRLAVGGTMLVLSIFMAGCGGGGGGAAVTTAATTPVASRTTLTPNYSAQAAPLKHWSHFPVQVYFANPSSYTASDGTAFDLRSVALAGFDAWVQATGGIVSYQITQDPNAANITVTFQPIAGSISQGQRVGQTEIHSEGDSATQANITLVTWDNMAAAEVADGLRTTATHEFGHALGITNHSDNPEDVMYRAHQSALFYPLTPSDVNTLKNDYSWLFPQ